MAREEKYMLGYKKKVRIRYNFNEEKMNMEKLKTLLIAMATCSLAYGADFKKGGLDYNILSATEVEVEKANITDFVQELKGDTLLIPSSVEHDGHTYQVVSIADAAFYDYYNWNSYENPAAEQRKIKVIIVSEGVKRIGHNAFTGNVELVSLSLPNSLETIGSYAFSGCTSLKSINSTGNVEVLEEGVFMACLAIESLDFLKKVRVIGRQAFWSNTSLASVRIPDCVDSIMVGAFAGCSRLHSIYIPRNVKFIAPSAFAEVNRSSGHDPDFVYGSPLTVVIDNSDDLMIVSPFGIDETVDSNRYNLRASMTVFFLGGRSPNLGWYLAGLDRDHSGLLPALIFVPTGLRETYLEPTFKINEFKMGKWIEVNYRAFSEFPYVCEFDSSIISEDNYLLSVRQAAKGGKAIVNGQEISDIRALGIQRGSQVTIQFLPEDGYVLKQVYWNHNPLNAEAVSSDGVITIELTDNARLDYFFKETESTGISSVQQDTGDGLIYDFSGRRLNGQPQKGIYIHDGKKRVAR